MMKCEICDGTGKKMGNGFMATVCKSCAGVGRVEKSSKDQLLKYASVELSKEMDKVVANNDELQHEKSPLEHLAEIEEKVVKRRGRPAKR